MLMDLSEQYQYGNERINMKINRSKRFPRPSKNSFDREVKLMESNDNVKANKE